MEKQKNDQVRTKRWMIFCEPCSFKKIIVEGVDTNMIKMSLADVPGGSPILDPVTKTVTERKAIPRNKAFKCPQCGRGVISKALPDVYVSAYKEREQQQEKENYERERQQRIEDGLLPEKPDFDPVAEVQKRKTNRVPPSK